MKKMLSILLVGLLALTFAPVSFASVEIQINDTVDGHARIINLSGPSTVTRVGHKITVPIVDSTLIAAGAANGGATSMTSTDLAVPTGYSYIRKAIANDDAYLAGTLADGKKGELKTIHITEQPGAKVFTVTPTTATGITSIGFDAVGESATLLYVDDSIGWTLFGSTNATINMP